MIVINRGYSRTCPACGKVFVRPVEPLFKVKIDRRKRTCCSYTCWNKIKEQQAERRDK